jgi:hypothetical protein
MQRQFFLRSTSRPLTTSSPNTTSAAAYVAASFLRRASSATISGASAFRIANCRVKNDATVAANASASHTPSRSAASTNIHAATIERKTNGTCVIEVNDAQKKSG